MGKKTSPKEISPKGKAASPKPPKTGKRKRGGQSVVEALASTPVGTTALMAKAVHDVLQHPSPIVAAGDGDAVVSIVAPQPASLKPTAKPDDVVLPAPSPLPDYAALSRNLAQMMEESGKLAAQVANADPQPGRHADMGEAVQALGQVAEHWFGNPARLMQAQTALTTGLLDLWAQTSQWMQPGAGATPPSPALGPADKRFRDPAWRENPVFDFLHKAFLMGSSWANDLVDKADGVDAPTRERGRTKKGKSEG